MRYVLLLACLMVGSINCMEGKKKPKWKKRFLKFKKSKTEDKGDLGLNELITVFTELEQIQESASLFTSEDPIVNYKGTSFKNNSCYLKFSLNGDSIQCIKKLQQIDGIFRNKSITIALNFETDEFEEKHSYTYTPLVYTLASATLLSAGSLITWLLMQDEGE